MSRFLDTLVNDNSEYVRREVLNTAIKYNLDNYIELLTYDNSLTIRREIAKLDNTKCNEVLLHQDDSYTYDCIAQTSTDEVNFKSYFNWQIWMMQEMLHENANENAFFKRHSEKQTIELVNILLEGATY